MSTIEQNLTTAHAEVKAEIARTDNKTALLLAFVGAVLAGAWTIANGVPLTPPALVVGGLGMGLLIGAAGLLLRSVRPNLSGRHGFPCGPPSPPSRSPTPYPVTSLPTSRACPAWQSPSTRACAARSTSPSPAAPCSSSPL